MEATGSMMTGGVGMFVMPSNGFDELHRQLAIMHHVSASFLAIFSTCACIASSPRESSRFEGTGRVSLRFVCAEICLPTFGSSSSQSIERLSSDFAVLVMQPEVQLLQKENE